MKLAGFLRFQIRRPLAVCLMSLLLAVAGLFFARNLALDSDLKSLLPKDSEAVINSEIIGPKAGAGNDILLMIYGAEFEDRVRAAEQFADYIHEIEGYAKSVRFRTPKEFFEFNKFLFIPVEDLDEIQREIDQLRIENEDLTDPLGLERVIREEESPPNESAQPKEVETQTDEQLDQAKELLTQLEEMRPYYMTEDGRFLAVRVMPLAEGLNIQKNRELLRDFRQKVASFDFASIHPDLKTEVYGGIERQIFRYESILADVGFGGWGILAIFLIVGFYFRSFWSNLILFPPLLTGLGLGLALVRFTEGKLNTIAVFLILVVFGVGIEFGIHLLARFLQERKSKSLFDALLLTWNSTGRATVTSAVALLTGFVLLTISSFQGFAQFGRVAVILLACTAGSFLLFMPAWIVWVEQLRRSRPWRKSFAEGFWQQRPQQVGSVWKKTMKGLRITSLAIFPAAVLICAWALRFDYQFDEKVEAQAKSEAWYAQYRIFTERMKASAFALFKDDEEPYRFMEFFKSHQDQYPEVVLVSGLPTFFPRDQEDRIEKLRLIADSFEVSWLKDWEDKQTKDALIEIKDTAYDYETFRFEDIPPELTEPFIAADNSGDQLVFLFDRGGATDGLKAMSFRSEVERLMKDYPGEKPIVSGPEIIFADVVKRVTTEGPWLILGMFLLVFLICWLDFRNFRFALITLSPVVFGFALTGALFVLLGGKINFYNMVALASLGSMVVDNSIHFFHRYKHLGSAQQASYAVSPTIITCTLTSICGYAGMVFANHSGIRSLGNLAVLGLACCVIAAVVFFPSWLKESQNKTL